MQPFRTTIRWLCRLAETIAIAALIAVTALIMLQIGGREFFNVGFPWADELARLAGLIVIFMGVPMLLLRDEWILRDAAGLGPPLVELAFGGPDPGW